MKKQKNKEILKKEPKCLQNCLKHQKNPFLIASVVLALILIAGCVGMSLKDRYVPLEGTNFKVTEQSQEAIQNLLSTNQAVMICDLEKTGEDACTFLVNKQYADSIQAKGGNEQ